jgi:hypothetical protein
MKQVAELIEAAVPHARPRNVLVMSNLMDFAGGAERSEVEMDQVMRHAARGTDLRAYLSCRPALVYYLRQMELNRLRFTDRANYECLMMDEHGGVTLDVPRERIIVERWERPAPPADAMDPGQYDALERLAAFLRSEGIRLVFIQTPYREGIASAGLVQAVEAHNTRVRGALQAEGHVFLDATDRSWPDDLFCDSSHMNGEASYELTRYVLSRMREPGSAFAGP